MDFFFEYTSKHYDRLIMDFMDHLKLVGLALVISIPLSALVALLTRIGKRTNYLIHGSLLLVYCIPSIALFSLLIPLSGLGERTAIIGLVAYNQIILLRSIKAARESLKGEIVEITDSIGMEWHQRLGIVYLPLMLPYLVSGLRIATVSTTGIASMAALINAGGLGNLLFEGMRTYHLPKLLWGIALTSGLALGINHFFAILENKAVGYANGGQNKI